eukprot:516028-Pleurochrysis_carterae.AAC.1
MEKQRAQRETCGGTIDGTSGQPARGAQSVQSFDALSREATVDGGVKTGTPVVGRATGGS